MSITRFKLVFFSPKESTSKILDHLFRTFPKALGNIGDYEQCAFVTRGTGQHGGLWAEMLRGKGFWLVESLTPRSTLGQFRPKQSANPTIGKSGQLEFVEEDRVELVVSDMTGEREELKKAIKELKTIHPYEEVAYDVYKLEDL